jgi:hypothetical protein
MTHDVTRRDFLGTTALAAVALGLPFPALLPARRGWPSSSGGPRPAARPFPLHDVRLRPGHQLAAVEVNRKYMLGLEPDRLLHMFRVTAGLPSSAEPLGGWEAPVNELRGHFTGHYLSACDQGMPTPRARR